MLKSTSAISLGWQHEHMYTVNMSLFRKKDTTNQTFGNTPWLFSPLGIVLYDF